MIRGGPIPALLVLALAAGARIAAAEVTSYPCMMAVAQGALEERRARYPEALALFEQAREETVCQVEAELGMARTFNSMNDHRKALAAARRVLSKSSDRELQAEAHYEIGRSLHRPGKRMSRQKRDAEAAYLRAVELSEGEHRAAIRSLLRLYRETRQDDALAAFQKRFPDVRASTRAERVRLLVDRKKKAPAKSAPEEEPRDPVPAEAGAEIDCSTRKPPVAEDPGIDLPSNCGERDDGIPRKMSAPQPRYNEDDRQARIQGLVEFEARLTAGGEVDRVRITRSLAPGLDAAVLEAVCRWRFEPFEEAEGSSPAFRYCGTTHFRLQ